ARAWSARRRRSSGRRRVRHWGRMVAQHRDEKPIGILRIDGNGRNLLPVAQSQMRPSCAAVGGTVDPIADGQVGTLQSLAAAGVDDVRIARRYGDRTDRTGRLAVENWAPGAPGIVRP